MPATKSVAENIFGEDWWPWLGARQLQGDEDLHYLQSGIRLQLTWSADKEELFCPPAVQSHYACVHGLFLQ